HIADHLDANAFVFVPITDFEISLSTLRAIKQNSKGIIVFDAHGATTAMDVTGKRHRKFWVDRDEWLPYIDVLKMNLEESQCMWFSKEYDHEIPSIYDENNTQLTRIYGISFPKQKELTEYLALLEEAKKRDHRKLGKELELFTFSQKVGQGLPLWLPNGAALRERLENFLKAAQKKAGYEMVVTPHIGQKELYVTSGHYEKYGADSFRPITTPNEGEEFLLKPMNCPHHCEIYNATSWSYRDLPKRFAEFGTVYRYEQSGELHGLTRVRGFTQDDAHIFCMPDQLDEEFKKVIDLVLYVFGSLGFENFTAQVSLRDPEDKKKYIGSDENWEKAENAIINAAIDKNLNYVVETGEAAFYGPKLDFMVK
ncbi:hypothetical protein LCGC14_2987040, partial [marine sediment metagenome]